MTRWFSLPAIPLLLLGLTDARPSPSLAAGTTVSLCPSTEADIQGAIAKAGAGGTVRFTCQTPRTVHFNRGITLSQNVTLSGSHSGPLTLQGNGRSRFFTVGRGVNVVIRKLTLQGAGSTDNNHYLVGGAIWNLGHLTIRSSTFSHNAVANGIGGAIGSFSRDNDSTLLIVNSTFSDNRAGAPKCLTGSGGAIMAGGLKNTIRGSTFVRNSVCEGAGAIFAGGPMTIEASTFVHNVGAGSGGAIDSVANVAISNSTFADNTADAGAAIHVHEYTVSIEGTIITGHVFSRAAAGGNCDTDFEGSIADRGYNLEWSGKARSNAIAPGRSSCFVATKHNIIDRAPQLRPLHHNGGPTLTMALPGTSPAIDAGIPTSAPGNLCANGGTDQRGSPRPDNGETRCDIGAYENQADTTLAYDGHRRVRAGRFFIARAALTPRNTSHRAPSLANGAQVRFTLGASTCIGATIDGTASCALKGMRPGIRSLTVRFAGNTIYQASRATNTITVRSSAGK